MPVSAAFKQSRSRFLISYIREGYYLDTSTDDNDSAAYKMKKEIRREQESQKEDRQSFIHKYMKQLEQELGLEIEDTDSSHDK